MSKQRQDFINKNANDVIWATKGTTIFPSVKMAQYIIESANGKGESGQGITMLKANNGFGIKADKNWRGRKMAFSTPKDGKPVNYFRVYNSPIDSIKDHTTFMLKNKRYAKALQARTPEKQIDELAKAGYSESPTYAKALKALVSAYNLKSLDGKKATAPKRDNTGVYIIGGLLLGTALLYKDEIKTYYKKVA
jgi:flagellum-specific peptidoglycan hydrolase FlgJ